MSRVVSDAIRAALAAKQAEKTDHLRRALGYADAELVEELRDARAERDQARADLERIEQETHE